MNEPAMGAETSEYPCPFCNAAPDEPCRGVERRNGQHRKRVTMHAQRKRPETRPKFPPEGALDPHARHQLSEDEKERIRAMFESVRMRRGW